MLAAAVIVLPVPPHNQEVLAMPSDTENPSPDDPPPTAKRSRGRPPAQSATETHQQRIARLQDELRQAQEALKLSEDRRASIVGHAVLRHIRHNTEFSRQLAAALRAEVKARADRAAIRDLIAEDVAPPLPASPQSPDPAA